MMPEFTAAFPLIIFGIALLALVIWLFLRMNRKARIVDQNATTKTDVLSEGAEKAKRNQMLIDAPLAPSIAQGPLSGAANTQAVAATSMDTDAEAGPQMTSAPVPTPAPSPAPAASASDLTRIKGVGPKLVVLLGELGVTTYAQIAAWSDADVERIDAQLGRFKGRIIRDQWTEQARLLAAGDEAGFTDRFGRNG